MMNITLTMAASKTMVNEMKERLLESNIDSKIDEHHTYLIEGDFGKIEIDDGDSVGGVYTTTVDIELKSKFILTTLQVAIDLYDATKSFTNLIKKLVRPLNSFKITKRVIDGVDSREIRSSSTDGVEEFSNILYDIKRDKNYQEIKFKEKHIAELADFISSTSKIDFISYNEYRNVKERAINLMTLMNQLDDTPIDFNAVKANGRISISIDRLISEYLDNINF